MGKLVFRVASDWQEVVRLRTEIEKLKQTLLSMDKNRTPGAVEALEVQLGSTRKRMDELVSTAAKAGAEMENGFKKKILDASQSVNGFTEKIIVQKAVVKDIEHDVRKLAEAYQNVGKGTPKANAIFADYRSAKRTLEDERATLFGLTQEQANARLSVRKLRDEYSLFKTSSGDVVKSNKELLNAIQGIPGPIGQAVSGVKSLTKASLAFIATPLGAILALLSAGLAALTSWFNRTEEGQNALNVASAYFKQTLDSILDVVDDAGECIWKAFTKPKEALIDLVDFLEGQVMNRLKAFGKMGEAIWKMFSGDIREGGGDWNNAWLQGVTGVEDAGKKVSTFMDDTNQKAQKRMKIAKRQNELDEKERKNLVEKSKLEAKINELREKAYDESIPEKDRAKAIKEASVLTKKMYDDEISLSQKKYEIIRDTNALSHSNKDAKLRESQAEAEVNRLQAAQSAAQRALLRQSNRFNNPEKADKLRQQIIKNDLSLNAERLAIMEDGRKKRLLQSDQEWKEKKAQLKKEYEDSVTEYKKSGAIIPLEVTDTYNARLAENDKAKSKRDSNINKETEKEFTDHQKELTSILQSEEASRQQSIKERYDKEREWAKKQLDGGNMTDDEYKKYTIQINDAESQEVLKGVLDKYRDFNKQRLDLEKKYLDECGPANFFGIRGNSYITPQSHSILPSITNKSLQQLAEDMGLTVERRPVPFEEIATFDEAAECGTAAVIAPISQIDDLDENKSFVIAKDGKPGPVCEKLYHKLRAIQYGDEPDTYGWISIIE